MMMMMVGIIAADRQYGFPRHPDIASDDDEFAELETITMTPFARIRRPGEELLIRFFSRFRNFRQTHCFRRPRLEPFFATLINDCFEIEISNSILDRRVPLVVVLASNSNGIAIRKQPAIRPIVVQYAVLVGKRERHTTRKRNTHEISEN